MKKMLIGSVVVALGISGAAVLAWGAPPQGPVTEHIKVQNGAHFNTSFDVECVVSIFSIDASDSMDHLSAAGEKTEQQHSVDMGLLFWNQATGELFFGDGSQDLLPLFGGDLNSAMVSAQFEVEKWQCAEDPTCTQFWTDCEPMGSEVVDVDLTWTGIGEIHQTIDNHTVHDGKVVDHIHFQRREREAIVTGTFSMPGFEFEIDDIGELYQSQYNASGMFDDCVDCDD